MENQFYKVWPLNKPRSEAITILTGSAEDAAKEWASDLDKSQIQGRICCAFAHVKMTGYDAKTQIIKVKI